MNFNKKMIDHTVVCTFHIMARRTIFFVILQREAVAIFSNTEYAYKCDGNRVICKQNQVPELKMAPISLQLGISAEKSNSWLHVLCINYQVIVIVTCNLTCVCKK